MLVSDPALVFGEFMGVIKGSEDTIGAKHRYLDRETYQQLSARGQGAFSHKRDDIYDLFMAYTKLKRQRQDYDAADRLSRLYAARTVFHLIRHQNSLHTEGTP